MRMDYKSDPSGGPIQTMLDTAFGGLIAGGRSFEPWFRAATRSNLEAYSLMSRRTLAYLELPMRLSQCRSPQDFASEQMRFWQDMFRQYAECGQKVMGAWIEFAQKASRSGGKNGEKERDYITFPEPEEASAGSRKSGERQAA